MTARIRLVGQDLELLPWRAAWWPARGCLIVADLHLGRPETLAADGVAVPTCVNDADLSRLADGSAGLGATRIIVVGDLVHSGHGLTDELVAAVGRWRQKLDAEVVLVCGNHDRSIRNPPAAWRLTSAGPVLRAGRVTFVHDPEAAEATRGSVCGHVHPVVHVGGRADAVRAPCFALLGGRLILPAFGRFTGGRAVRPGPRDRAYLIAGDRVIEVPRAAPEKARVVVGRSPRAARRVR